jgi:short-subunit dehydrogenase
VILVTGCSSGIGLAIAEMLHARRSYRVVVTARASSVFNLKKRFSEDERFRVRVLDVISPMQVNGLISEISEEWGGVDILINNAGISYRSVLEHMTDEDESRQMEVNYFAPARLIREVLPGMREKGRGKIINVSSVSGMLAMPTMASYSASKSALEGMSEALWYEVKPLGVNVSVIQPGFVRSRSFENVIYSDQSFEAAKGTGPYSDYYQNMIPFIARLMTMSPTNPKSIAKLVFKVIRTENPPLWIPATLDAWLFYYMRRLVPRRLLMALLFAGLPRVRQWGSKYTNKRGMKRAG